MMLPGSVPKSVAVYDDVALAAPGIAATKPESKQTRTTSRRATNHPHPFPKSCATRISLDLLIPRVRSQEHRRGANAHRAECHKPSFAVVSDRVDDPASGRRTNPPGPRDGRA